MSRAHWVSPVPQCSRLFERSERYSSAIAVPRRLAPTGSSSYALNSPSESFRSRVRPGHVTGAPSLGFAIPLRDVSQSKRCPVESPTSRRLCVLGVSHALDAFRLAWPCGFISPHCHVQGSLFRGFSPNTAGPPFDVPEPSRRSVKSLCRCCHLRRTTLPSPSGLCAASGFVARRTGFSRATHSIPS